MTSLEFARDSERLQLLYAVNDMLKQVEAEGLNLNLILPQVLKLAVQRLNAEDGSIVVVNADLEVEHAWLADDDADRIRSPEFLKDIIERGLAGWAIRHKQATIVDDTRNDNRWLKRPGHITSRTPWSVICTPFIVRTRVIGTITILKPGLRQFDSHDLNLLAVISSQAASTIENARLLASSQRQLKVSALLNEASRVINSSLDIDEIMQLLLSQMNELFKAEALSIALVDRQTNELVYQVAEGIGSDQIVGLRLPSNQGLSGWVMEHGEAVLVPDTAKDPRFNTRGDRRTGHPTRAMICAPIQHKGEVLGTIQAINPIKGTLTNQDLELFVNLANIASSAIANAQQYRRTLEAESRYTRLFQDSIDPIVLTNIEGIILEANNQAFTFFGHTRQSLIGMPISQLHAEDASLPTDVRISCDDVHVFRSQALTNDDEHIHVEVHAKRTQSGGSELLQWIYHDISEQIALEEMRQELTAMLLHDLQSPLGNVMSSLELIRYEISADSSPTMVAMMDIAVRSSERLHTLIRSLLDISRLEAGKPITSQSRVEIGPLVREVKDFEAPNFERRGVQLVTELEPDLPEVLVEADMIRRVLVNLIGNALKYSEQDQQITVSAVSLPESGHIQIAISDQGPGIPQKYRRSIFDKYTRVSGTSSKGLGLGLAFCRLAVEGHGGRIWVEQAPGGGARFVFTLPAVVEAQPA